MKDTRAFFIGRMIFFGIAMIALVGYAVMLLWNWLIPDLFNGPAIGYWQALGLLALSKILFSGFHKHGHNDRNHDKWKNRFKEKFHNMSPEEKERMKKSFEEKWRGGCSHWDKPQKDEKDEEPHNNSPS